MTALRNRRGIGAIVLGLVSCLGLSACGGQTLADYNRSVKASGGGTVNVPAEDKAKSVIDAIKADSTLRDSLPSSIRSEGLKVSTAVGYPPMELYATDGKTPIGLDPSLARALAKKLGVGVSVQNADFNSQIPGVTTKRFDMIMSSMTDSKEREKTVSFVDYVAAGAGMLVKKGNPDNINSGKDVCGKTVAVVDNGSSLELAKQYSADCTKAGKPAVNLLKFTDDQDALLSLTSGRAQVNLTDYVVCVAKASEKRLGIEAVELTGTDSPWGIAMRKDDKDLIEAVRAALDSLIKSGEYRKILDAWGLGALAVDKAVVNGAKS